jgi:DNA processing protein
MEEIDLKLIPRLLEIYDPPKKLFVKSQRSISDLVSVLSGKTFGIVGSREMSETGERNTKFIVDELAPDNCCIVSGMARGIDSVAHQRAIDRGLVTIAVLGTSVDVVYPKENKGLYENILNSGGFILSEVPVGKIVKKEMFAARNRIVSGLSDVVIIVEAQLGSGTMVTAKLALDQGREIYCFPGSPGTDYLIEQGAMDLTRRL